MNSFAVLEEVLVNHSHVAGCGFDIEFEFESHNVCRHLLCFKCVILGDIAVKIFTSHNADFAYVKAEVIVCVSQFEENVGILTGECKDELPCGTVGSQEADFVLIFVVLDSVTVSVGIPFGIPILDTPLDAFLIGGEGGFGNDLVKIDRTESDILDLNGFEYLSTTFL